MVKSNILALSLLFAGASAFAPSTPVAFTRTSQSIRYMSEEESEPAGALVPIKEDTIEFGAGVVGGVVGLVVGGPVVGLITAAAANYVSKAENDVGEVARSVSTAAIEVYNYLANLDAKYALLKNAQASLQEALDKVKSQNAGNETIEKVEKALASTTDKIKEVNDEYDLVGAGVTSLGVVGDLVEKAVAKAGELNEEYQLTDKATSALKDATEKAKAKM